MDNIVDADHVNTIIAAGRTRAIAPPHFADPFWTLHAAAQQRCNDIEWPKRYLSLSSNAQLEKNLARTARLALSA